MFSNVVDVGNQASPQQVYFGTEYHSQDLSRYAIPVEILCGFFFIVIALAFVGPGQELGRGLKRWPSRVQAYTLNIVGSIVELCCSRRVPGWKFRALLVVARGSRGLGYFYFVSPRPIVFHRRLFGWGSLTAVLLVARWSGSQRLLRCMIKYSGSAASTANLVTLLPDRFQAGRPVAFGKPDLPPADGLA